MRKAFTFYSSYYESIKELPIANQNELYRAIIEYSFEKKEMKLTGISRSIWFLIKPNIDNNISKYENGKKPKTKIYQDDEKEIKSESEAKDKQKRSDALSLSIYNTYGIYNRIRLTNIQYNKLIEDYNKELIDKQIILLDEYIQSNNNKQKYTDFNLVLRKSIRENWFKDKVADKLPHWIDKKIEKQEMSKEEEEELKKGL